MIIYISIILYCTIYTNSYYLNSNYHYTRSIHIYNSNNNKDISCEKEGSCRQIRGAFKDELNKSRYNHHHHH